MKSFSIPMALTDFIPVVLFFLGTFQIANDLKKNMTVFSQILCFFGIFLVTAAGAFKALYKLFYAAGLGDFTWLNNQFFANQAIGFLFAGIGFILVVRQAKSKRTYAVLPVMALVGIMVIGLGAMDFSLSALALRQKQKRAVICFLLSFLLSLAMGYLSSRDFSSASMNWIAQGINTLGQFLMWMGCHILHKELIQE